MNWTLLGVCWYCFDLFIICIINIILSNLDKELGKRKSDLALSLDRCGYYCSCKPFGLLDGYLFVDFSWFGILRHFPCGAYLIDLVLA